MSNDICRQMRQGGKGSFSAKIPSYSTILLMLLVCLSIWQKEEEERKKLNGQLSRQRRRGDNDAKFLQWEEEEKGRRENWSRRYMNFPNLHDRIHWDFSEYGG